MAENVLFYLVEIGLQTIADKFIGESTLPTNILQKIYENSVFQTLPHRWKVVNSILKVDSESAINSVNLHFPGFLDQNPITQMRILLLKLGNLIKHRDTDEALVYCRGPIADLFRAHPECGDEMQKYTLLLIAPNPKTCQNNYLLETSYHNTVAFDVSRQLIQFSEPYYQFHEIIDTIRLYKYSQRFNVNNSESQSPNDQL